MTKRTYTRLSVLVAAGAATIVMAATVGRAATTDQELFDLGNQALQQGNLVEAAMYLFAYLQRYPAAAAQNPAHASQVNAAIDESRRRIYENERLLRQQIGDLRARLGEPGANVSGLTMQRRLDPPAPPPQPSFPLACRGAGNMRVDLQAEGYGLTGTMFAIEFRRAAGAGAAALGAGECSWLDRPVSAAEPNRICDLVETTRLHLEFATNGAVWGLASRSANYLPRLIAGNDVLTFRVFNNGQGCLVATAVPPLPGARGRGRL